VVIYDIFVNFLQAHRKKRRTWHPINNLANSSLRTVLNANTACDALKCLRRWELAGGHAHRGTDPCVRSVARNQAGSVSAAVARVQAARGHARWGSPL